MPSFSIVLQGKLLARVSTDGLELFSIHVSGTRVDDELACVEAHGGVYSEEGKQSHLIWISSAPIRRGDQVEVVFSEDGKAATRERLSRSSTRTTARTMAPIQNLSIRSTRNCANAVPYAIASTSRFVCPQARRDSLRHFRMSMALGFTCFGSQAGLIGLAHRSTRIRSTTLSKTSREMIT
jgi:hypothetical protein